MKTQKSKCNPHHELPMPIQRPYLKEFFMLSSANRRARSGKLAVFMVYKDNPRM
jgi:hypothetical protein